MTGSTAQKLEGTKYLIHDEASRRDAIHRALDYRGDVTIHLKDGTCATGFVFDGGKNGGKEIQLFVPHQSTPVCLSTESIIEIHFAGRDAAEGKSWESWLKRVAEAEARGEIAELYPDAE